MKGTEAAALFNEFQKKVQHIVSAIGCNFVAVCTIRWLERQSGTITIKMNIEKTFVRNGTSGKLKTIIACVSFQLLM